MRSFLILLVVLVSVPLMAQTDDLKGLPGYVDFGALDNRYGQAKVEINLGTAMLGFVAALSESEEPEASELLRSLEAVRVFVYEMDDAANAVEHIQDVAADLKSDNWVPIVVARDEGELVNVFVLMTGEVIEGLTVMAAGDDDEAVFINIVGELDPSDLSKVTNKFDIDLGDIDID